MIRLSSNITLVLRIAVPVLYITFFGFLNLAIWLVETDLWLFNLPAFKIGFLAVYLSTVLVMFLTIIRLKRVEFQDGNLYVSDYFYNVRYPISDVQSYKEYSLVLFTLVKISLHAKGRWGKNLYFLAKNPNFDTVKHHFSS